MSIRPLPSHVIDKLKSSVTITSLNGVACGLLANALDAGASKVHISVDYTRGNCVVEDDGSGIHRGEFEEDGGLGKLHYTSRFPHRASLHGRHGDFLASLANLSLLVIASRHQSHLSHNSIIIHNSNVLARDLPAPPEQRLVNFEHGTRVTVRDLFGTMPVRVKQRPTANERVSIDKEWLNLIREVVALLLAWPTSVVVSLKNVTTQRELRFRPPEQHDAVSRASRLLTQASLVHSGDVGSWVPISASSGPIIIKGCICETPAATRRAQFISLGIRPMMNEYGTDVIYEEINRVFQNSSFGVVDGDDEERRRSPKVDEFAGKDLRSRKAIERWPMFYLKIVVTGDVDLDDVHRLGSQGQVLAAILDLMKATCYGFLKKNHFRPRRVQISPEDSVFSTSKLPGRSKMASKKRPTSSTRSSRANSPRHPGSESQSRPATPFNGWNHVKIGRLTPLPREKTGDIATKKDLAPLVGECGKLLRKPFTEPSPEPLENFQPSKSADLIMSGSDIPFPTTQPKDSTQPDLITAGQCSSQRSGWLQRAIDSWENPVFAAAQSSIPQIGDLDDSTQNYNKGREGVIVDATTMSLNGRVSREALAHATVISQVDRKFILVKLPLESNSYDDSRMREENSALVMLDQHAVDERCRLEDLMAEYFDHGSARGEIKPHLEALERPLTFEVTLQEHRLLEEYRDHFASWGIVYNVITRPKESSTGGKVVATALPPSILERCRQEPRLLIELLRKEAWNLNDGNVTRTRPTNFLTKTPWISRFRGCPQGVLELLHSRACRSAIMFNDVLTNDECSTLLARLSRSAFPFQCAHGRPSMAPLVDLGAGGRFGQWQERRLGQDKRKWHSWMKEASKSDGSNDTQE